MTLPRWWAPLLTLAITLQSAALNSANKPDILAPGYGVLEFQPPAAGTYTLPPLGSAGGGQVLNSDGQALNLDELIGDKLVLLGFIYTHCGDINGCPLASFVMKKVQQRLLDDVQLRTRVRLISLSFDPELDTPAALTQYSLHFRHSDFDWQFLTTASEQDLLPILEEYGQWRQVNVDADGNYSGSMSHILRVFLIDRQRRIRNIYSTGFLHADTVINDMHTLAAESQPVAQH